MGSGCSKSATSGPTSTRGGEHEPSECDATTRSALAAAPPRRTERPTKTQSSAPNSNASPHRPTKPKRAAQRPASRKASAHSPSDYADAIALAKALAIPVRPRTKHDPPPPDGPRRRPRPSLDARLRAGELAAPSPSPSPSHSSHALPASPATRASSSAATEASAPPVFPPRPRGSTRGSFGEPSLRSSRVWSTQWLEELTPTKSSSVFPPRPRGSSRGALGASARLSSTQCASAGLTSWRLSSPRAPDAASVEHNRPPRDASFDEFHPERSATAAGYTFDEGDPSCAHAYTARSPVREARARTLSMRVESILRDDTGPGGPPTSPVRTSIFDRVLTVLDAPGNCDEYI